MVQPTELRWHVPSHEVDPASSEQLEEWLSRVDAVISIHGYGRLSRPRRVLLGGSNRGLAGRLGRNLSECLESRFGFEVVGEMADIPPELRGLHPANPVNRPPAGGVQLELPPSARGTGWFGRWPGGAPGHPADQVVEALVRTVEEWSPRSGDGRADDPG